MKFRRRNYLWNTKESKDNEKQVTGKNSHGKEYPGFHSMLDTGLQECNQGRPQRYCNSDAEEQSFKKRM